MKRPTPLEFTKTLLALVLPAAIAFFIFLMFVGCGSTEEMYRVSGPEMYTIYTNKHGDLIEVPWNDENCKGYKKPYHTTQYNNVGSN